MPSQNHAAKIAEGRQMAAGMNAEAGRSCADDRAIGQRIEESLALMADAVTARDAGHAAFEAQRNLDILHARALGECVGCARTADGRWGHRVNCSAPYARPRRGYSISFDYAGRDVIVLDD
jgi:hypothetical protein